MVPPDKLPSVSVPGVVLVAPAELATVQVELVRRIGVGRGGGSADAPAARSRGDPAVRFATAFR